MATSMRRNSSSLRLLVQGFVLLLLLLILDRNHGLLVQAYFTESIVIRRTLPSTTTPRDAYAAVLRAWRHDNLGLPLPPPIVLHAGDATTGVGLVLLRIPPAGLQEGIVGCDVDENEATWTMHYRVLNPALWTWPVQRHAGTIVLRGRNHHSVADTGTDADTHDHHQHGAGGTTTMEWTVQWTPLLAWLPYFGTALKAITTAVIETAANHVVKLCQEATITSSPNEL